MARGRKKKPKIWVPSTVKVEDTRLWNPHVPTPWMNLFELMTIPLAPDSAEPNKIMWRYTRLVLAEVIRQRWDKNLVIQVERATQKEIEAHGRLASKLISGIHGVGAKAPLSLFYEVFWEGEWNGFVGTGKTKTEVVQQLQRQNALLREYQCPFSGASTKKLFLALAHFAKTPGGQSEDFYRDVYRPLVQEREKFTRFVRDKGRCLFEIDTIAGEVKPVRQGTKILRNREAQKRL